LTNRAGRQRLRGRPGRRLLCHVTL